MTENTKTIADQLKDEMDDLDDIDTRLARWETRFEEAEEGTYPAAESERQILRLTALRLETKATIKRLRAAR